MPLGLARDSMVDLAEMARKAQDGGEFKASIEYDEDHGENNMITVSIIDDSVDNETLPEHEEKAEDQMTETDLMPERNESKVQDLYAGDDKASIASSSVERPATPLSPNSLGSSQGSSYGRYSGFGSDYAYYENYSSAYTSYSGTNNVIPSLMGGNKKQQGFWCCLFPWTTSIKNNDELETQEEEIDFTNSGGRERLVSVGTTSSASRTLSRDDDEVSTGSDIFGEKLSEKEKQAVLARLGLGQPDIATNVTPTEPDSTKPMGKGLLNGIHMQQIEDPLASPGLLKGILKKHSTRSLKSMVNQGKSDSGKPQRRSLFPSYSSGTMKEKKDLNLSFSPMARVLTVKSHKDMDTEEKGELWWQKEDYEEFRKTGRLITRAMLEGGSEIWLATNRSWQLPNQSRSSTLKYATSLAAKNKGDMKAKKEYEETRDKWWHKFGHSRRGLEHMASIDEGRQRQANVRHAIRAVVEEGRRQKALLREDADKLRMVSIQHTLWARDLALAAGASDADAVSTNFNDDSRKSREFYLLKFSRAKQINTSKSVTQKKSATMPAFMRPTSSLTVKPNILDVNTNSQIRYRHAQRKSRVAPTTTTSSTTKSPVQLTTSSSSSPTSVTTTTTKDETEISSIGAKSLAKQAAGFASGKEVANMSAILTGMGPTTAIVGGA